MWLYHCIIIVFLLLFLWNTYVHIHPWNATQLCFWWNCLSCFLLYTFALCVDYFMSGPENVINIPDNTKNGNTNTIKVQAGHWRLHVLHKTRMETQIHRKLKITFAGLKFWQTHLFKVSSLLLHPYFLNACV